MDQSEIPQQRVLIVIPARMGSSRFPGKPLAKILGKTMIETVVSNALESKLASTVCVATCDEEIAKAVKGLAVEVVMTSASHTRASDRTFEAVESLKRQGHSFDLVLMLQGDEPCIEGQLLDRQIDFCMQNHDFGVVNLVSPLGSREEASNPNTIKVVLGQRNQSVLYMTRSLVAASSFSDSDIMGKQVCSIAFSPSALANFAGLEESKLEVAESIDMLRFIANAIPVHFLMVTDRTHPVDVPSDIPVVERMLMKMNEPGL